MSDDGLDDDLWKPPDHMSETIINEPPTMSKKNVEDENSNDFDYEDEHEEDADDDRPPPLT